jgi:hypothetical protein
LTQAIQFRRHTPARGDQICHEPFINIKITFIFAEVANGMTFVEHAPYLGAQSEGVRQAVLFEAACRDHSDFQAARPRPSPDHPQFGLRQHTLYEGVTIHNSFVDFHS